MRIVFLTFIIAGLVMGSPVPAQAADPVGDVKEVKVFAYGTPPRQSRAPLYPRANVFLDERLETVSGGGLRVALDDGSNLVLGSDSAIIVDDLVYSRASRRGSTSITLRAGFYRYASTYNKNRQVTLKTPVATIGIRGTELLILVEEDGATTVVVRQGAVHVTTRGGAQMEGVRVTRGREVTVRRDRTMGAVRRARGGIGDLTVDFSSPYRPLRGTGTAHQPDSHDQGSDHYGDSYTPMEPMPAPSPYPY